MGTKNARAATNAADQSRRAAEQSAQRAAREAAESAVTRWHDAALRYMRTDVETARMVSATWHALQVPGVSVRKLAASLQGTRKNPAADPINGAADIAALSASRIGHMSTAGNLAVKAGIVIPSPADIETESGFSRALAECLVAVQGGTRGVGTGVREAIADAVRARRGLSAEKRADALAGALNDARGQRDEKPTAEADSATVADPETGEAIMDEREDEDTPTVLTVVAIRSVLAGLASGIASGVYTGETFDAIESGAHAILAAVAGSIGDTASIESALADLAAV